MKRFRPITIVAVGLLVLTSSAAPAGAKARASSPASRSGARAAFLGYHDPLCQSANSLCSDVYDAPGGEYSGHDEPSLEFNPTSAARATT